MKIKVSRTMRTEQIIDVTPEEYCIYHASLKEVKKRLPSIDNIVYDNIEIVGELSSDDQNELERYFDSFNA